MKTKLGFLFHLWMLLIGLPSLQAQSLETQLLNSLSTLDTTYMSTHHLYERSVTYADLPRFDGHSLNDSTFMRGDAFPYAFGMIEWMRVAGHSDSTINYMFETQKVLASSSSIEMGALCYEYNRFKPYALDSNLISWDSTTSLFSDVLPRSEIPYMKDTTFIFSLFTNESGDLNQAFRFDPQGLFGNVSGAFDSLEIDFGDGNGWQTIDESQVNTWSITYSQYDTFMVKMRFTLPGGQARLAQSQLILDASISGMGGPTGDDQYADIPDTCIKIGVVSPPDTIWVRDELDPWGLDLIQEIIPPQHTNGVEICYWYNNRCGDQKVRKPLIIVDGFDPKNKTNADFIIGGYTDPDNDDFIEGLFDKDYDLTERLGDLIHAQNYDVFFINYVNSTLDQEVNVDYVKQAIELINDLKAADGSSEKNIVVGASMGGLVGKWALRKFEQAGEDHETELFLSFDSPLQGANIPLGLQAMLSHMGDHKVFGKPLRERSADLKKQLDQLKSTAAKNMVYYHIDAHSGAVGSDQDFSSLHDAFYQRVNNVGDLDIPHVAIANGAILKDGTGKGIGMSFGPADILLDQDEEAPGQKWLEKIIGANVNVDAVIRACGDNASTKVYDGNVYHTTLFQSHQIAFNNPESVTITDPKPWDSAPGGMRAFDIVKDGKITQNFAWQEDAFCFIPTISALDLEIDDPYFQSYDLTDKIAITTNITQVSSYDGSTEVGGDRFKIPGFLDMNMEHVQLNQDLAEWLLQLISEDRSLTSPLTTEYNFGEAHKSGPASPNTTFLSTEEIINEDLYIEGTGRLVIAQDDRIGYTANVDNPFLDVPSEFDVHIIANECTGDSTTVYGEDDSEIEIGQNSQATTGTLQIHKDCKLILSDNHQTTVRSKSEIHVWDEGKLIIEPGAKLRSQFEAKVYVHSGGKLIVRPGGILQIMHQSELIVEPGGKLILEDGAKVRLWDGQGYDGEANIHVYGELDVRGGIDFSGNGYFKFEPNNILTHNNAPFSLEGEHMDIRFIQLEEDAELNIGDKGTVLSKGKVVYHQQTAMNLPYQSKIICDSVLFAGPFTNGFERAVNLTHTKYAVFADCDFNELHYGISADDMNYSSSSVNLQLTRCNFAGTDFGVTVADGTVARMTDVFFDGWGSDGWAIGYEEMNNAFHDNVDITQYKHGGVLLNTERVMFVQSDISECTFGILDTLSHVFFHDGSSIVNCGVGVEVTGDNVSGTIVEFSCSGLMDNDKGVHGYHVYLSIDAGQAVVGGSSGGVLGTNIFECDSFSQQLFDLREAFTQGGVILGRNNYWGGGKAHSYRICHVGGGGCGNNGNTTIDDTGYLTTEPLSCTKPTHTGDPDDCDTPVNDPDGGGITTNGELFLRGHGHITNTEWDSAYTTLLPVAQTAEVDRDTMDVECQSKIDYSRAYTGEAQTVPSPPEDLTRPQDEAVSDDGYLRPVPAVNKIFFDEPTDQHVEVYDLTGQLVLSSQTHRGVLLVGHLPSGVYVTRYTSLVEEDATEVKVRKFIKQ